MLHEVNSPLEILHNYYFSLQDAEKVTDYQVYYKIGKPLPGCCVFKKGNFKSKIIKDRGYSLFFQAFFVF